MKNRQGFSLIELLVTMVVISILLTIAAPALKDFVRKNQISTNANTLVAALNLARSEAIKRNADVIVRHKGTTAKKWEEGWDVFVDLDANETKDDDDTLLRTYPPLPTGFTLRTGAHFSSWMGYSANGRSRGSGGSNGTFRLCADDANKDTSRAIIINSIGRARTEKTTTTCP